VYEALSYWQAGVVVKQVMKIENDVDVIAFMVSPLSY